MTTDEPRVVPVTTIVVTADTTVPPEARTEQYVTSQTAGRGCSRRCRCGI